MKESVPSVLTLLEMGKLVDLLVVTVYGFFFFFFFFLGVIQVAEIILKMSFNVV